MEMQWQSSNNNVGVYSLKKRKEKKSLVRTLIVHMTFKKASVWFERDSPGNKQIRQLYHLVQLQLSSVYASITISYQSGHSDHLKIPLISWTGKFLNPFPQVNKNQAHDNILHT